MTEHRDKADEVERELDDMQQQSERLKQDIDATREDWDRKKVDVAVPGAGGEPLAEAVEEEVEDDREER